MRTPKQPTTGSENVAFDSPAAQPHQSELPVRTKPTRLTGILEFLERIHDSQRLCLEMSELRVRVRERPRPRQKMDELKAQLQLSRELVAAIEALREKKTLLAAPADRGFIDSEMQSGPADKTRTPPDNTLTLRQQEVVRLVAEGKTNKEMASILFVSVKTIETHRANIMKRLGCHSMSDLILYAVRNNIIRI